MVPGTHQSGILPGPAQPFQLKELYSWNQNDGCLPEKTKIPGTRTFTIQHMPWELLQIWELRKEADANGYAKIIALPGSRLVLHLLSLWLLKTGKSGRKQRFRGLYPGESPMDPFKKRAGRRLGTHFHKQPGNTGSYSCRL